MGLGGGIVAAYAFLTKDAPKYLPGYGLCITFTCLAIFMSVLYCVAIALTNAKRQSSGGDAGGNLVT